MRLHLDVPWESLQGEVAHMRLTPKGGTACTVGVRVRPVHRGALVTIDTVGNPEAAATWRGANVEVQACHIPPCEDGEFYLADLEGVAVFDVAGVHLGTMRQVMDNAGQPLGVIAATDGSERLLPLVPQTIKTFERAARRLEVCVPLGLWDA